MNGDTESASQHIFYGINTYLTNYRMSYGEHWHMYRLATPHVFPPVLATLHIHTIHTIYRCFRCPEVSAWFKMYNYANLCPNNCNYWIFLLKHLCSLFTSDGSADIKPKLKPNRSASSLLLKNILACSDVLARTGFHQLLPKREQAGLLWLASENTSKMFLTDNTSPARNNGVRQRCKQLQVDCTKFFFTNDLGREWNKHPPSVVQCDTIN